jgi:iron-sulfur cluster repair protein YtfE (RIC family)
MDALEVLRQMHLEAKSTFQQIEQARPEERGALWAKLRPELTAHEQIEERFVYDPVAKEAGNRDQTLSDWEQRHHEQVNEAEKLISAIGRLEPREPRWLEQMQQLRTTLERHIQQEEGEIWPRIRQVWGEEKLRKAGTQVQAAKTAAGVGASVSGAIGAAGETVKDVAQRLTRR